MERGGVFGYRGYFLILTSAACLWAAPVFVPSTGLDANNDGIDDYYQIWTSASEWPPYYNPPDPPPYPPSDPPPYPAYVAYNWATINPPPGGSWVGIPGARWIAPKNLTNDDVFPIGYYEYRTTFDLTNFDFQSLVITGTWAADGHGRDILINGKPTGITTFLPVIGNISNYTVPVSFVITHGSCEGGCFTGGINSLTLLGHNGGEQTGIIALFHAEADPVPEPATFITLLAGLATLTLFKRGKRSWRR